MTLIDILNKNTHFINGYVIHNMNQWNYEDCEKEIKYLICQWLKENNYKQLMYKPEFNSLIDEYYHNNYFTIRNAVRDKENELKEKKHEQDLYNARTTLFETIPRAKKPKTIGEARRLKYFGMLMAEDQERVYKEYIDEYNKTHEELHEMVVIKESFPKKIETFVIEHPDEFLNFNQFKRVTKDWDKGMLSDEKCYEIYKNLFYKQPENNVKVKPVKFTGLIGFKSSDKVKALQKIKHDLKPNNQQKSSFPLKKNIKEYQLHKVSSKDSYLIDLLFIYHLCYLVAININTRYLYVKLTNIEFNEGVFSKKDKKSSKQYLNALRAMIDNGMKVKYLSGDGEKAFNSTEAQQFYLTHGIVFKSVPRQISGAYPDYMKLEQNQGNKTSPLHSSLGLIDRVIRTIRNLAYNMNIGLITPNVMNEIVYQYNNAPHKTLSKYAGYSVSPQQVQDDPELEKFIVRKIIQENYNIQHSNDFQLKEGTNVKVYNETNSMMKRRSVIQPGVFTVKGFNKGLYDVEGKVNGKNTIQRLPRYKIAHIWE